VKGGPILSVWVSPPHKFSQKKAFTKFQNKTILPCFKLINIFLSIFYIFLVLCEVIAVSSHIQETHTSQERFPGM